MQISYSKPNDLDISGTTEELLSLRENILQLSNSENIFFAIETKTSFDPFPYQSILSRILIRQSNGATKISVVDDSEVLMEGSPKNLEALASFFDFSEDDSLGAHSHYEYFEGNQYIAPDSVPLVISVKPTN